MLFLSWTFNHMQKEIKFNILSKKISGTQEIYLFIL